MSVDPEGVREALRTVLPELAERRITPVPSNGTVVALYRVGAEHVVRLPLVPLSEPDVVRAEQEHAREIAQYLPVPTPRPVAIGPPCASYPGWWSVWTWLPGVSLDHAPAHDQRQLAHDLAAFVHAHHAIPARGRSWNGVGRGGRQLTDSPWVRRSIERSSHLVDAAAVTASWERALAAPPHEGPAVFIHADLMPGNLLVAGGRLAAVIDNGPGTFGDPASDLAPAFYLFDEAARGTYRDALALDKAAWERARGWALEMAIGGLHYYEHTNPGFFAVADRTLRRLLADTP